MSVENPFCLFFVMIKRQGLSPNQSSYTSFRKLLCAGFRMNFISASVFKSAIVQSVAAQYSKSPTIRALWYSVCTRFSVSLLYWTSFSSRNFLMLPHLLRFCMIFCSKHRVGMFIFSFVMPSHRNSERSQVFEPSPVRGL